MANAIILPPATVASIGASTTALGDAVNLINDYAGMIWRSASATAIFLTIDLGANVAFDTIALFGVRRMSRSLAQWAIRYATSAQGPAFTGSSTTSGTGTNNFWQDAAQALYAGAVLPENGKGVAYWSRPDGPPTSARYIQLIFSRSDAAADDVEVSRVVIGKRIQLARNFSYGAAYGVRDLGSLDFSPRGALLRRRGAKLRTAGLTFSNMYKDEVEASTKPLIERIGNTEMVALVVDPAADAQRQNRCYFGPLVGDLTQTWRNAAGWEAKVNMVSIF